MFRLEKNFRKIFENSVKKLDYSFVYAALCSREQKLLYIIFSIIKALQKIVFFVNHVNSTFLKKKIAYQKVSLKLHS